MKTNFAQLHLENQPIILEILTTLLQHIKWKHFSFINTAHAHFGDYKETIKHLNFDNANLPGGAGGSDAIFCTQVHRFDFGQEGEFSWVVKIDWYDAFHSGC